jgi:hypothetical protein
MKSFKNIVGSQNLISLVENLVLYVSTKEFPIFLFEINQSSSVFVLRASTKELVNTKRFFP